ncbi:Proton-coupled amino acid transporter 4 [Choanephora cucurbitarum]|uniref:Proton-coupled amino acid transporter 4 n=1 Tax=Choanephora cucurbitarum TaxID=101091 RepID=A0A1C7N5Y1_9FUNG|nr:Proton-coupled amino acid transporter 4 [Choanephora cucurbitarum]
MSVPEKQDALQSSYQKDMNAHDMTASEHEIISEKEPSIGPADRLEGSSSVMAYLNVVCAVAGSGIVGLPLALKQGGWIGLLILFLSWSMSIFTAILLIKCLYAGSKQRLSTYMEVATEAFGKIGGYITYFFNAWILLGGPVLYMLLSGQNINQLCKGTVAEIGVVPWTIISCVVVGIPFIWLKTMKEVAVVSIFGMISILMVVFVVLIMSIIDKPNQVDVHHDPVIWSMFPISLSTIAFSFGGNVVYPHIESSMKKPRDWSKVALAGLSTCAALYLIIAVCGYAVYGDRVENPIYNSLPAGAGQIIACVVITIHVLTSAPVYTTSFSLDIEEMWGITVERFGKLGEFLIRATIRIIIMAVIGVIACTVPHFSILMSLIGAFGQCSLIFVLPIVFYLKLTGFRNKSILFLFWCFLTVLLGIVGLIFGSIDSIRELVAAFS